MKNFSHQGHMETLLHREVSRNRDEAGGL